MPESDQFSEPSEPDEGYASSGHDEPTGPAGAMSSKEEGLWSMACHLGGIVSIVPFAAVLVPLIIWMTKRDDSGAIAYHGKEALNFQLNMLVYTMIAWLLVLVAIGMCILPVLYLVNVILPIIAAIKAYEGERYRYPAILRVL